MSEKVLLCHIIYKKLLQNTIFHVIIYILSDEEVREMPIIDLHNHTTFSYDGKNTPEAIIQNAIAHNVDVIGITDHQFTIRQDLEYYISYLKYCKKKYSGQIQVLLGLEIGTRPAPSDLLASSCAQLDYVLFECLDDSQDRAMDLFEFLEWSRMFQCRKGLAHTDIFALGEKYGLDMIKTMRKYNLFWELNTSGNYTYYYDFLTSQKKREAIQRSGLQMSIGSDTHSIDEYRFKQLKRANELLSELKIPLP